MSKYEFPAHIRRVVLRRELRESIRLMPKFVASSALGAVLLMAVLFLSAYAVASTGSAIFGIVVYLVMLIPVTMYARRKFRRTVR
jgi:hypothetical protein